METEREKQEEGLALRIKHWVTAHYHRHQPADAVRTLVELLRLGREEEVEGVAEGWRPTIEQLFWWTFVSQGPHAALAFLDGAEVVTEAPAPAVFVVAASCLVGHDSMLGAAAARMPENFWKRKLVLSRASRALELASNPAAAAAAAASSTAMMAKVAVLLLRGGDLLLEALQWHSVGIGRT
ncbi:uncharacterized protein ACA1_388550 [Acanthamoeba castellanii str. Neff]|uniref:Uncharacterized protein n=1 Tax=Acanthamoeba castellanii (strain ATCC 30010 / Neff) TaxID=1257118 RepID=L8GDG5_ACACF|nr:uncharacterized protein ACA1_388550 [Acanthamoeba castellanii str. Neff]ELR11175.1 hypothetical protein ACA1_388550 [Acanthamoeba castellanii str. Neff]